MSQLLVDTGRKIFTNYREAPGVLRGACCGPGKFRIKRLEITLFGTIFGGLFGPPSGALSNNLWMSCAYPVGRGWTQNIVFGPIPASVKKPRVDR